MPHCRLLPYIPQRMENINGKFITKAIDGCKHRLIRSRNNFYLPVNIRRQIGMDFADGSVLCDAFDTVSNCLQAKEKIK